MHIKRIIIQGFKTYKNTTVIDLISPHHNVVVGRNGSGKSNFFAAIRFVLSDAYTHMTREERQGLIHEGSGTVMSAYVEIVFDNTDRRFPINKDEISIRRTIGLKKDDYSLDGRSSTRSDIMNLLESAGFSRSNPYYIVPQGRITALTNSKDHERLALLKEVSGAKVFESKLKESMKEMESSDFKKQRIDEALKSIDERISDLQVESKDLKEFQSLEKSKKILEYNLFSQEQSELNLQIDRIDVSYNDLLNESRRDLEELDRRDTMCQELKDSLNELKISLKMATLDKEQTNKDYKHFLNAVADKKWKLNEIQSTLKAAKEQYNNHKNSIENYKKLIAGHEKKIAEFRPNLEKYRNMEAELKGKLTDLLMKQRSLYSKQNRFSKFKSKTERDNWLNSQIAKSSKELKNASSRVSQLEKDVDESRSKIYEMNSQIERLEAQVDSAAHESQVADLKEIIEDLKRQIFQLTDDRKRLWREEIRLRSVHDSLNNDLNDANFQVNQTMDRAQAQGLAALKIILTKLQLTDSVYGPLAELFSVSDKYKTAVEVVGGNSLFHVVVDNDSTASLLMNELVRAKAGRVTFMPLNRINPPSVQYPDSSEHHCIPLIKKVKVEDERVMPAIRHVFGRTIVCSNLQKGSELARSFKVNAITLDGDRAEVKGVLSGGYRDQKNLRLDALKTQIKKKRDLEKIQEDLLKCAKEIESINHQLTSKNNDLHQKSRSLDSLMQNVDPLKVNISQLKDKKRNLEQVHDSLVVSLESARVVQDKLSINIKQSKEELASTFTKSLSEEEQRQLNVLNSSIAEYETQLDDVVTKLTEVETSMSKYESELSMNYKPTLEGLLQNSSIPDSQYLESHVKAIESEIEYLTTQLDTSESRNQAAVDEYNKLTSEINRSEELLQIANEHREAITRKLGDFSKETEKNLAKKAILVERREEIEKKIRDLGVLPEEAFSHATYEKVSSNELLKRLNTVNNKLTKYSHVNKKAIEQYHTFTKERDDLVQRKSELEISRASIENLINNLKTQKDQAITKSFKQVAKSFNEIFEKLVPAGTGRLIMQKKSGANEAVSEESEDDFDTEIRDSDDQGNIENYVGVSISASFNSKKDEQQRVEQFSGGQKSLCAITLILAIQKCDPAPFYLFDEIDANLDTQYRTAVAAMINVLSLRAQFICTTFRREMLQVADKFYGVMFNNKVSTVSEINREEAMTFVEGQLNQ